MICFKNCCNNLWAIIDSLSGWPFINFYLVLVFCNVSIFVDSYHPYQGGISLWNEFNSNSGPQIMKKFNDPKHVMVDAVNNLGLKLLAVST